MRQQSVLYKGDPNDEDARFAWAAKHQRNYSARELTLPDWNPVTSILEEYTWDPSAQAMIVKRTQECQQTLDDNAEWRAAEQNWRHKDDKWVRFASIPLGVVEVWMQEGINVFLAETDRNGVPNEHMKAVLGKLRDPDWQFLMTTDMDMGDGNDWGNYRLSHVPGNGLIWPTKDGL